MKHLFTLALILIALISKAQTKEQPLPQVLGAIAKPQIKAEEAKNHIGETLMVCDVVMDGRFLETSATQPTLLNLGAAFPNHHLTIFISKEVRAAFENKPEEFFKGKKVCVTGKITEYRGKPQIAITKKEDLRLELV